MSIDIVEIWFRIANRQMSSNFDGVTCICPRHAHIFVPGVNDIKEIWFGTAYGQISSMFDSVICPRYDNGGI